MQIEDVKKLADLARIDISKEEMEEIAKDFDSILAYVGQVTNTTGDLARVVPKLHNVMREDVHQNTANQYTEDILKNAPAREGNYLKVKKILGNSDDII